MDFIEPLIISDFCLVKMLASVSALLLAFAGAYSHLWRRRYPPCPAPLVRIRGMIAAVPSPQQQVASFRVRSALDATAEVLIEEQTTEYTAGHTLQWSKMVTVDCVQLPRRVDTLYRESGVVDRLVAVRITQGAWPEQRWLSFAIMGLVVFLSGLMLILPMLGEDSLHSSLEMISQDYSQPALAHSATVTPLAKLGSEPDWLIRRQSSKSCHWNFATCVDQHPGIVGNIRCQNVRAICLGQFHPTLGWAPCALGGLCSASVDAARPWWHL